VSDYVPGLAGVPAARSAVSFIDGEAGILEYRGIRVETLAVQSNYEEVAYLLLFGKLPTEAELKGFSDELNTARRVPGDLLDLIRKFPAVAHPMDALQTSVAALGMDRPNLNYSRESVRIEESLSIIARLPTIVAAFHRSREGLQPIEPDTSLGHAADFLRMVTGEVPDELSARVMDACLIIHADHTMNASTFTARVTASTGASPYAVVSAAVGSLSGSLHGGANERALTQLRKIGSKSDVRDFVTEMLGKREKIMGLGHRVYKTKDPRARILQGLTKELFEKRGRSDVYDIAIELENVAKELLSKKGIYPNVDFYSGIVYDRLGVPGDLFTPIFAVSRSAGWLAHWLEQMDDNRLFRPRQIYEGRRDEPYVSIGDRGR
jgi:citrate synthase